MVGRYGEDKFCVLAQIEHRWIAEELAEHIRAGVERIEGITVSVGVACAPAETARINDLISSADAAKYNAQQEGRNRIHVIWRL
jgi:diguanylate cyclase (GGDEF)-like protein